MARDDLVKLEGTVEEIAAGGIYRVKLDMNEQVLNAKLCGKMRRFSIKVLPGDRVTVGLSPYDLSHGLILFRN
ncbi:MAG: translation initiation factor IF-1 [Bdellovibrionota bacterium]|jgi:translation initiation factor IF-1